MNEAPEKTDLQRAYLPLGVAASLLMALGSVAVAVANWTTDSQVNDAQIQVRLSILERQIEAHTAPNYYHPAVDQAIRAESAAATNALRTELATRFSAVDVALARLQQSIERHQDTHTTPRTRSPTPQ